MSDGDCETWALDDEGNHIPGTGMRWVGPERCEEEWIFGGQCVGEKGHEGPCWFYGETGSYNHWGDSEKLSGIIPPDHDEYPNPVDMQDQTYMGLGGWEYIEERTC